MKENILQDALFRNLWQLTTPQGERRFYNIVPNVKIYEWESDLLFLDHRNFCFEFEIKTTAKDFKADFKKTEKHATLADSEKQFKPNCFYYLLPVGAAGKDNENLPKWAGLYEWFVTEIDGVMVLDIKHKIAAPKLHENAMDIYQQNKLLRTVYFKYWKQRCNINI